MGQPRQLNRAPLREALVDIRFDGPIPLDFIRKFAAAKAPPFGGVRDIWQASVGMQFPQDGGAATSSDSAVVGVRLDSATPPHVVQFRMNGFTFSRLHPYDSWESLRRDAETLWAEFAAAAAIKAVSRVALRYINELKLPLPLSNFDDYLTVGPRVPASLPQGLSGFLHRVAIVNQPSGSVAIVTQAMEDTPAGASPSEVTVVLDIDVFYRGELAVGDAKLAVVLMDLHDFKNQIFFSHLTDKALELFE